MNSLSLYRSAAVVATAFFLALSSGCVVAPDEGYNNGYASSYPGYYEPYGAYYGGWGPDYYVAPYRFHDGHSWHGAGHPGSHATPSIPSRSRSRKSEFR